jgi:hypothetical protein
MKRTGISAIVAVLPAAGKKQLRRCHERPEDFDTRQPDHASVLLPFQRPRYGQRYDALGSPKDGGAARQEMALEPQRPRSWVRITWSYIIEAVGWPVKGAGLWTSLVGLVQAILLLAFPFLDRGEKVFRFYIPIAGPIMPLELTFAQSLVAFGLPVSLITMLVATHVPDLATAPWLLLNLADQEIASAGSPTRTGSHARLSAGASSLQGAEQAT